jgi:hypothetical protein
VRLIEIVELASDMRPTRSLDDLALLIKLVEARIAIGLQDAFVAA